MDQEQRNPSDRTGSVRVVIADDHPVVRGGLEDLIRRMTDFEVVASVGSERECIDACRTLRPDLLVLDVALPELPGRRPPRHEDMIGPAALQMVERMCSEHPDLMIVAISGHADAALVSALLDAGCRGFVHKLSPPEDLVRVLTEVVTLDEEDPTRKVYDHRTASELADYLRQRRKVERAYGLTEQENQVLVMLHEGASNIEIAQRMHVSRSTVARLLRSIFKKLDVSSRTEAVAKSARARLVD